MKHHAFSLSLYWPFTKCKFQEYLAYRFNVIIYLLSSAMRIICFFFLWKAIFVGSGSDVLNGYTFADMVVYLILSTCVGEVTAGGVGYMVHKEIRDGSIAMSLIKPISFRLRMYFTSLGDSLYTAVFMLIPCLIASVAISYYYGATALFSVMNCCFFVLTIILSLLLNMTMSFILGMVTFLTKNIWGISQIYRAIIMLLSGALIPLSFFPSWATKFLEYAPFASMVSTPVNIFLGKMNFQGILKAVGIQVFWIVGLYFITEIIWKAATKRLVVQGG